MGLTERTEVEEAVKAVLKQFRVEGLLLVQILQHIHEHPMRAYRGACRACAVISPSRSSVRERRRPLPRP